MLLLRIRHATAVGGDFQGFPFFYSWKGKGLLSSTGKLGDNHQRGGPSLGPLGSPTFCPKWKASPVETHHLTPTVCCWETWLKEARCTHTQHKPINDSHHPPHTSPSRIQYLSLQLGCLGVKAAAHWSLSGKAAGVVCMVPYGFHSTQPSPFQWAVVELMWDTLRQSRPLGFGLSAVHCDALLWNSPAQAVFKKSSTLLSPSQCFFSLWCISPCALNDWLFPFKM